MTDLADWIGFMHTVSVIELCIAGYCLYRLVKPFLQSVRVAAAAGGIYFLTMLVLYAEPVPMDAFDVSVILNNALQNAVENAGGSGERHISILSYKRNNAYLIEISNSFAGDLRLDTESGLPVTTKGETESHGYGLSNIRKIAGKYFGDIDFAIKNEEFILSIMLMME